jgi:hypothetical protein
MEKKTVPAGAWFSAAPHAFGSTGKNREAFMLGALRETSKEGNVPYLAFGSRY